MRRPADPDGMTLGKILRHHALLAVLVLIFLSVSLWLSRYHDVSVQDDNAWTLFLSFLSTVPRMIFFVVLLRLLQLTYVEAAPDRFATLKSEVVGFVSDKARMTSGFLAAGLMATTLIAFAQLKNLIPAFSPFVWDEYFMNLDKALHFGTQPYVFAHAAFGGHYAISFFVGMYNLWLFLLYFVLLIACFQRPDSRLRMQYLVAFLLAWAFGGNLIAGLFSSAGPVYYANLGLGDTYAGLMDRLYAHADTGALSAVETQALLWTFYSAPTPVGAISAFPSMHVTSSVLMAIYASQISRWYGYLMSTFALIIMIGSVLLAWHYAVDGYAGGLIAVACWFAAGWLLRWTPLRNR